MQITIILFLILSTFSSAKAELKSEEQRLGYALGYQLGVGFNPFSPQIDQKAFSVGFKDGMNNQPLQIPRDEQQKRFTQFLKQTSTSPVSAAGIEDQEKFLRTRGLKEEVQTTASGLRYVVQKKGSGQFPNDQSILKIIFTTYLFNGSILDSSYPGRPIELPMYGQIPPGLKEGLKLVKPGGQIILFVPPQLGFGATSVPGYSPNSTLIYDIEVLGSYP